MINGFKHTVLSGVAYFIPLGLLRKKYLDSGSEFWAKILCTKAMHILTGKEIDEVVDKEKYICFREDVYNYKVFNMCYMSNMLGKALLATALGAVPVFKVADADNDNYFEQYFDEIDYGGKEILTDSKYEWSKKNAPGIHWDMNKDERTAYQKLYEKYFVLKEEVKKEYDLEYKKVSDVMGSSKGVGIVLRGTDYLLTKPKGHPIQPDVKEIVRILEKDFPDYEKIDELVEKTGRTKYKEYKIFNRNVLSKAKDELNKKTSLIVDYEPIKSGRKTVGIRFFVDKKDVGNSIKREKQINKDDVLDDLIDLMHDYFKVKEIKEIAECADYDIDKIKQAYDYMQSYNTTVDVPIAFMKDCIKNEYYNNKAKPISPKKNSFNNFEQRTDINFEELEKQLLDN